MNDFSSGLPIWLLLSLLTALGAIWGSFIAALCSRWPKGESVARGRSQCDHCSRTIAAYDLVPIISFCLLSGRCRYCSEKIGGKTLIIELLSALIGAISVLAFPGSQALAAAIFGWLLLPLVQLDFEHLWLPNRLIVILAIVGFFVGPVLMPAVDGRDRMIGACLGFLSMEAIRLAYKKYRQQEGMGAGDPKLLGALGIWLGWALLPVTLLLASAIGLAMAVATRHSALQRRDAYPMGSFLAIAAFLISLMQLA